MKKAHRLPAVIRTGLITLALLATAACITTDGARSSVPRVHALFYNPQGVAVDPSGTIYVADSWNLTIRKITPTGIVSTLAGVARQSGSADGAGAAARFVYPCGVAVDNAGTVYVADGGGTIRRISPQGLVSTLAGMAGQSGSADGTGAGARFDSPHGVAVDGSRNVYVVDTNNSTIRKITPTGEVTTLAGMAGQSGSADGLGGEARFNLPQGVAVDSAGNVYVADTYNYTIRKITPEGKVTTLAGQAGQMGSTDTLEGNPARFNLPSGVAVDASGTVYVADTMNSTIRRITAAGATRTLAGTAGQWGYADGMGDTVRFHYAMGLVVGSTGDIYVADTFNKIIRKITPTGGVTTLAGIAGQIGSFDGIGR